MILGDVIEHNARMFPGKDGVVDEKRRVSFAELADRARRFANALAKRGTGHGDRVAIVSANCHEYVEIFSACEIAGYVAVPINSRLTPPELEYLILDSQSTAIVFDHGYASFIGKIRPSIPSVKAFFSLRGVCDGAEEYEEVLANSISTAPRTRASPEDPAFIVYTSGTTGRPKGVIQTHRAQILSGLGFCMDGSLEQQDRILITNPLYHSGGKWMQLGHHLRGCSVFLHQQFDPKALLETVEREKITCTLLPATMLAAVLDHPDLTRHDLSSLRTIYYSAGPTPVALVERALAVFGPILIQYYGGTEAGGLGTALLKHHHVHSDQMVLRRRLGSAGQSKPIAQVNIVRADGSTCDINEPGEIIIHSDAHMHGYWNNAEATADTLRDGWIYTGDIGIWDEDFFVYIVDRKKEMIISGGANIYSREVEDALLDHPAVLEAAVIGVPHEKWGEGVHAVVAPKPGITVTGEELIAHCRTRIASYKKPTGVTFVDALPRQSNGKIDKLALRKPFWAGRDRQVN